MFTIGRGLSALTKGLTLLGTLCVVLMMLHVTADVVGRYLFNAPLIGTIVVVANYYMIALAFLALAVTEEKRAHISVEFVADMLPKRAQSALDVFGSLFAVAVMGVVAYGGWTEAMKKTRSGTTMEQGSSMIEIWQSYWIVPIGAALMALVAAYRLIVTLTGARSGLQETDPSAETFIHE